MLGNRPESAAYHRFEVEFRQLQEARDRFKAAKLVQMQDEFRLKTAAYLQDAWHDLATGTGEERDQQLSRTASPARAAMGALSQADDGCARRRLRGLARFRKIVREGLRRPRSTSRLEAPATSHCRKSEGKGPRRINAVIQQAFVHYPPQSMQDVAAAYGKLLAEAEHRWKKLTKDTAGGKQPSALPDPAWEELRQTLYRQDGPGIVAAEGSATCA